MIAAATRSGPLRAVLLGLGARGRVYSAFAAANPDRLQFVCIAEAGAANLPRPEPGGAKLFTGWEDAVAEGARLGAEAAVIALPDALHAEASQAAMSAGMDILLEKPVGRSWEECLRVRDAQRSTGRLVLTGYVLRFSPYYRRLARTVASGAIGDVVSIHHLAAVGYGKASHAFCRGNWAREADGATALVQKCTHDFDLIGWWMGGRRCGKVSSFGSLAHWRAANAPDGSAERCLDCMAATREKCPFDSSRLYLKDDALRYHFPQATNSAMERIVAESQYGRCVYRCENDAVDHQTVIMEYEGGLVATLEMEFYTRERARETRIFGTRGEISADGKSIEVRPFAGETFNIEPHTAGGHGGGDDALVRSFIRLARSKNSAARNARILDSELVSHRIAFAAEESRKSGAIIPVAED